VEIVVEVTQNWISGSAKSGPELDNSVAEFWPGFEAFFYMFFWSPNAAIRRPMCRDNIKLIHIFMGQICSSFFMILLR